MTVTATNAYSGPYTGNGSTTAFPFTFKALTADEVYLEVDGLEAAATISLNAGGGTATASTAPSIGTTVYVRSRPDFEQGISLYNNGPFSPSVIEEGFDRSAARDIYLNDKIDRSAAETLAAVPGIVESTPIVVTSAPGQAVASRGALAGISSPASGQLALLTEAGREGQFKFSTSDHSAHVTADTYQGLYVAPSSDTDGSSGAWVRVRDDERLRASWYGVSPSNSEATNTAIMSAILAANLPGNVSIIMPLGVIPCRVTIPGVGGTSLNVVEICGEVPPATWFGTVAGYTLGNGGTVLKSTTAAASAVSGGVIEAVAYSGGFSMVKLIVRNLTVQTFDNPTQNGIMGYYAQQLDVENVSINTSVWPYVATQPTTIRYGLRVPGLNNGAFTSIRNVTISGFYYGMDVSENLDGDNLIVNACRVGLEFLFSYHAIRIGRVGVYRCTTPIIIGGQCRFGIEQMAIERVNPSSEAGHWGISTYDVVDTSNLGHGSIRYAPILGSGPGAGEVSTFTKNGAASVRAERVGEAPPSFGDFFRGATQSISDSATTSITWDTETTYECALLNPDDHTQIIFREAGTYRIDVTVPFAGNATGERQAKLYDGATVIDSDSRKAAGTLATTLHLACAKLVATAPDGGNVGSGNTGGTRVVVQVLQNSGGALNVSPGADGPCRITVEKLRGP